MTAPVICETEATIIFPVQYCQKFDLTDTCPISPNGFYVASVVEYLQYKMLEKGFTICIEKSVTLDCPVKVKKKGHTY